MKEKLLSVVITVFDDEDKLRTKLKEINSLFFSKEEIEIIFLEMKNYGLDDLSLKYDVKYIKADNKSINLRKINPILNSKYVIFVNEKSSINSQVWKTAIDLLERKKLNLAIFGNEKQKNQGIFNEKESVDFGIKNYFEVFIKKDCLSLKDIIINEYDMLELIYNATDQALIYIYNPKIKSYVSTEKSLELHDAKIINNLLSKDTKKIYLQEIFRFLRKRLVVAPQMESLKKEDVFEYKKVLIDSLKKIPDIIISESNITTEQKLYLFNIKYDKPKVKVLADGRIQIKSFILDGVTLNIGNILLQEEKITFYSKILDFFDDVYLITDDKKIKLTKYILDKKNKETTFFIKEYAFNYAGYKIEIDLNAVGDFYFAIKCENNFIPLNYIFRGASLLNGAFDKLYLRSRKKLIRYDAKKKIFVVKDRKTYRKILYEINCRFELLLQKKFKPLIIRILSNIYSLFNFSDIWIVIDRLDLAGDNGEAFFRYAVERSKENKKRKIYFAISKNSADYLRLKKEFGSNIINFSSLKYKIIFLNSNYVFSSQASPFVVNPFGRTKRYLGDLYKFKFIFLQHGIIKSDLSSWLNINNINIHRFICSSNIEEKYLLEYRYNYPKDVISLTGLARYDLLVDKQKEKTILVMLTWRKNLASRMDLKTGQRQYNPDFKKSQYFLFYNKLINDNKLLNFLREKGIKLRFVLHPNVLSQARDYQGNDMVQIVSENISYRNEFNNCSMLITDYSSVFFDVAYLKKPIIYSQFDRDIFFEGQIYDDGFFIPEKHGFGVITKNLEETIDAIINTVNNNFLLEDKYDKRIDEFYKFFDNNNSKRIYDLVEREYK